MHRRIPLIKAVMTPFPYSVQVDGSVGEAAALMREHRIRHLPVVDGEDLVGVVSDRHIRMATEPAETGGPSEELTVGSLCERNVYVAELTERLDGVLDEMLERRIGSAIVVKADRVVGIFTTVDACRFLRRLLEDFFPSDDSHVA
jgi:acetoin utilization protein AcuB